MKNKIINLVCSIGIFCLGCVIGYCSFDKKKEFNEIPVFIRDTIPGKIPEPEIIIKEVPAQIDTAAILAAFYAEKNYRDTIVNYPELQVSLTDVVSQNTLLDRKIFINYQRPEPNKYNTISIGADFSYSSLPMYLSYRHKRMTYKLGYDIFNKTPVFGFSFDIWQW